MKTPFTTDRYQYFILLEEKFGTPEAIQHEIDHFISFQFWHSAVATGNFPGENLIRHICGTNDKLERDDIIYKMSHVPGPFSRNNLRGLIRIDTRSGITSMCAAQGINKPWIEREVGLWGYNPTHAAEAAAKRLTDNFHLVIEENSDQVSVRPIVLSVYSSMKLLSRPSSANDGFGKIQNMFPTKIQILEIPKYDKRP